MLEEARIIANPLPKDDKRISLNNLSKQEELKPRLLRQFWTRRHSPWIIHSFYLTIFNVLLLWQAVHNREAFMQSGKAFRDNQIKFETEFKRRQAEIDKVQVEIDKMQAEIDNRQKEIDNRQKEIDTLRQEAQRGK